MGFNPYPANVENMVSKLRMALIISSVSTGSYVTATDTIVDYTIQ